MQEFPTQRQRCFHLTQPRLRVSVWALMVVLGAGCASVAVNSSVETAPSPEPVAIATPTPAVSPPPAPAEPPDPYPQALEQAASAVNMSRAAQSQDDWRLAVSRWQQAVQLMQQVPTSSPNHASAQSKLGEYRRNLAIAQQQASRGPSADASVILSASPQSRSTGGSDSLPASAQSPMGNSSNGPSASQPPEPQTSVAIAEPPSASTSFRTPIVRRAGGTPVIRVTFNGGPTFDMILDTGASGTLVTQRMASQLGLRPVGTTTANTANARNVTFPLTTIDSMEAGGLVVRNVPVAIAGPDLNIGLLGNDFFGNHDVVIRQNEVEFRAR